MSQSQVECPIRTPRVIYVHEAVVHRPIIILLPGSDVSPLAHLCHALLPSAPLDRSVERSHDLRRRTSALVTQGFHCCCDGPAGADRCETLWSSAVQVCSMFLLLSVWGGDLFGCFSFGETPSRELVPLVDPWDTFREQLSAVCCSTWSSHTQHSC